jgi:hypothetical protein
MHVRFGDLNGAAGLGRPGARRGYKCQQWWGVRPEYKF